MAGERVELEEETCQGAVAPAVFPASDGRALETARHATPSDFILTDETSHHGILAKIVQQL